MAVNKISLDSHVHRPSFVFINATSLVIDGGLNKRFIGRLNIRKMQVTPNYTPLPCRSEPARESGGSAKHCSLTNRHREQAQSYKGIWADSDSSGRGL
ncbi:hypothetical protein EMIT0P265_90051 [Pseudomonas zeae]